MSLIQKTSSPAPQYVSSSEPSSGAGESTRLRFRLHSPLSMDLYDRKGDHTGIATTTVSGSDILHVDEEIPNSYYFEMGDTKYAGATGGQGVTVALSGYATSTFDFDIDQLTGDTVVASTSFSGVPVTPETKATFTIDDAISDSSNLDVDTNGDGTPDISLAPVAGETVLYIPPPPAQPPPEADDTASTSPLVSSPEPSPPDLPSSGGGGGLPVPQVTLITEAVPSVVPFVAPVTATVTTPTSSPAVVATTTATTEIKPAAFPKPEQKPHHEASKIAASSPTAQHALVTQTAAVSQAIRPGWYAAVKRWVLMLFARIGI